MGGKGAERLETAPSMDNSVHDGTLGIKPFGHQSVENGGETPDDTQHSKRRYLDSQSIHGDSVSGGGGGCRLDCCLQALAVTDFIPPLPAASWKEAALSWPLPCCCRHCCCRLRGGEPLLSCSSLPAWATCGAASASCGYGTCPWQTPPAATMTSAHHCERAAVGWSPGKLRVVTLWTDPATYQLSSDASTVRLAGWLTLPCRLCALHVHVCRHLAASEGAYQVTEWLLTHHVDVNALDRFRRTPLEVHMGAVQCCAGLGWAATVALLGGSPPLQGPACLDSGVGRLWCLHASRLPAWLS